MQWDWKCNFVLYPNQFPSSGLDIKQSATISGLLLKMKEISRLQMIRCNFYLYDVHYDERLRKLLSSLYARMLCNIVIFLVGSWSEFSSLFHYSRSCRILKKLILHSNFCLCSWAPQVFLNNTWTQSVLWTFSEYFMYTDDTIHKIT